ncbi:MAG: hypothetical protein HYS06_11170 [Methylocystis sp.]|nr:hypothetical protein [Methylocystis sp.]MBI3274891.1 hypothetical protein [Methylocystis sp.]
MFGGNFAQWYCVNVADAPYTYALLLLPLVGTALYGRGNKQAGVTLIAVWIVLQLTISISTLFLFQCNPE